MLEPVVKLFVSVGCVSDVFNFAIVFALAFIDVGDVVYVLEPVVPFIVVESIVGVPSSMRRCPS